LKTGRLALLLLTLAVAAAILAGCGGDEADPASGTGAGTYTVDGETYTLRESTTMLTADITKAEFISRMNRLCREAWPRVAENLADFNQRTKNTGWSKQKRLVEAVHVPILTGITFHIFDGYRIFGAPKGQKRVLEEVIGPMRIAVETGEREQLTSEKEVAALFTEYNQRARRYGLDQCIVTTARLPSL
jgi:hypothetical protein